MGMVSPPRDSEKNPCACIQYKEGSGTSNGTKSGREERDIYTGLARLSRAIPSRTPGLKEKKSCSRVQSPGHVGHMLGDRGP